MIDGVERLIELLDQDGLGTLAALEQFRTERRDKRIERALQINTMHEEEWFKVSYIEPIDVWDDARSQVLHKVRKSTPIAFQYQHREDFAKHIGVKVSDLMDLLEGRKQELVGKDRVVWVSPTFWPFQDRSESEEFKMELIEEDKKAREGLAAREKARLSVPKLSPVSSIAKKWMPSK
jgi:hypothetical protein